MAAANTPPVADDGWQDVETESQIVLEKVGDTFTYRFLYMDEKSKAGGGTIPQAHFEDPDSGETLFINAGVNLAEQLKKVPEKSMVRVTWASSLDTGAQTPMRVYKVQYKR